MKVIITGCAGFIGMHVSKKLLEQGVEVIGVDNLNDYYDINLKKSRLEEIIHFRNFDFKLNDITDSNFVMDLFSSFSSIKVIHLAAQAGVRYSLENPQTYIDSNIQGFINILEASKKYKVDHLIYASSSSVYGKNNELPFTEDQQTDFPLNLYAATKKANELMAYSYSHLYNIPTTGLRFFTVYGPWGRPDMAFFKFTKNILNGGAINIFNNGNMTRDFTYIDDIVEGILRVLNKCPSFEVLSDKVNNNVPYKIFNIGNGSSVKLMDYILALEYELGIKAKKNFMPMQPGDMHATLADTRKLHDWVDFNPSTKINMGIRKFVNWYKNYYLQEDVIV